MSLFGKNNTNPIHSVNSTKEKHKSQVLFRTKYGVISIIDPDSIKRFQIKCGIKADGKIGHATKAAIKALLLDSTDINTLDKIIPIRSIRTSELSTKEAEDLVERLIRESGSF